jgi:hypothetical protein
MPLQHAYTFLLVALNEGQGVMEYAEKAGVAQTVMTRQLLDIGSQNRKREPGYGLVMQRLDPLNLRRHQTFLTKEGRALLHELPSVVVHTRTCPRETGAPGIASDRVSFFEAWRAKLKRSAQ